MSLERLKRYRTLVLATVIPILLLPLPLIVDGKESRCAYCVLIISAFWCLELVPLPVTALFPLVLFPITGILSASEVSPNYFKDTNVLIFAGLVFAVAVEQWGIQERIALRTLMIVGSSQRGIMFGFMLSAWFLSGWLNNTATTTMIMPIAIAILQEMRPNANCLHQDTILNEKIKLTMDSTFNQRELGQNNLASGKPITTSLGPTTSAMTNDNGLNKDNSHSNKVFEDYKKGLILSIAYACNIGGTTTLPGTVPNAILPGIIDSIFGPDTSLNFGTFMMYSLPQSICCLLYIWVILQLMFLPAPWKTTQSHNSTPSAAIKEVVTNLYQSMGPHKLVEKILYILLLILVFLWFFRSPKFISGWASLFKHDNYISDGTVGAMVCLSLFFIPSFESAPPGKAYQPILEWSALRNKIDWGLLLLLGGGFAMAAGIKSSELDVWLLSFLSNLHDIPRWLLVFVVVTLVGCITELTSNGSTAAIVLPLLARIAVELSIHPFFLMIPATTACSFAFCLPVATPPNAIAYAQGGIYIRDMVKVGIFLNIGCFVIATTIACTWGNIIFDMNTFPAWANITLIN